jgi:hypothetical protein
MTAWASSPARAAVGGGRRGLGYTRAARFLEAVAGKASPDTRTHVDHALLTLE